MIVDMRTYTYYPDTYRLFLKFYQEQGYAITSKHLGFNLGLFTASSGIVNRTIQWFAYQDHDHRDGCRKGYLTSGTKIDFTNDADKMIRQQESRVLIPTDFSPLRTIDPNHPLLTDHSCQRRMFEFNTYECLPGHLPQVLDLAEHSLMPLSQQFAEWTIAYLISDSGPDRLYELRAHSTLQKRTARNQAMRKDERCLSVMAELGSHLRAIVAPFLSLAMVLALASCSSQGGGAADTPDKETTPAGTESSNTEGTTGEVDFSTKVNWIFATQANEGATDAALFETWMEMVTERSGGAITFNYQPGGTLGYGSDLILQAMDGTIQAAVSGIADYTNYSTLTEAFQLPFLINSYDLEWQAIQLPEFQTLLDATGEEMGLYIYGVFDSGMRHIGMIDKPINTTDDLKGVKLRTASSELLLEALTLLGASPIVVNYNEVYSALQNGVVDGEDVNYLTAVAQKHYEIIGYMSEIGMYPYPSYVCFNRDAVEALPDGYWEFMKDCMDECMEDYFTNVIVEADAEAAALMEENGVVINQVSDADAWAEAMQPLYDEYLASADERVVAFVEAVQALKAAE